MSIMKRMRDISLATLNDKLEKSEDPIRLIDQYIHSQKEQIAESERLYEQCVHHAQMMRKQYLNAEQLVQKRAEQAALAVKANEEAIARLALQEKLVNEEKAEQYRKLYEQGQLSVIELETQLQQLKADLQEVIGKRQFYIARLESIKLQQKMNERRSGSMGAGSNRMFDRLEEKINDLEFETSSLRDVRNQSSDVWTQLGTEIQETVERELEHLRNKLQDEGWLKK